ncbi:MAG: DMT family transporter [Bdellovibrionales bacterium]
MAIQVSRFHRANIDLVLALISNIIASTLSLMESMRGRILALTSLTMIAFAANSILCRLALKDSANDPLSFTLIRLLAGGTILSPLFLKYLKAESWALDQKTALAPVTLFVYALFFSLAYVQVGTGVGALILFASVQLTMIGFAYFRGQRLARNEKLGFILASCGFVYLVLPGLHTPPFVAAVFMAIAGMSWGSYSLLGQGAANPVFFTARNFVLTTPFVIALIFFWPIQLSDEGLYLAILSGAVTSGLGYVLWYIILKNLKTSSAAIVQLSVPAIAAFGGFLLLHEAVTLRLLIASVLIFSGIFIKVQKKLPF